eukprot:scaffold83998_cov72-Phaeocystis_antarctica.AAC.2
MCERDESSGVWLRGSTWRGWERARTCPRSQRARWERVYILKSRCLLEYTRQLTSQAPLSAEPASLSHGLTRTSLSQHLCGVCRVVSGVSAEPEVRKQPLARKIIAVFRLKYDSRRV